MLGTNEKANAILKLIKEEHTKKQPFARFTDAHTEEIVRATFALLLKVTDSLPNWRQVSDSPEKQEAAFGKLVSLWSAASRMRIWFVEQKKVLTDKHKEEEWEKAIGTLVKTVQDKVALLLMFRSPEIAEKESRKARKTVTLIRTESVDQPRRRMSEAEIVKTRLDKWKNLLIAKTEEESKELTLTSSTLKILQTGISCASLVAHLENYYLRGMAIYASMTVFQRASSYVYSKKIRMDVLAWVSSIFKSDPAANLHYAQKTTSCGTPFQYMLRGVFFNLINQVLDYVMMTKNPKELECLMDALKWNYTASDHVFLKDCRLFHCLRAEHRKCLVSSLWGKQADDCSETLLDTFEYIAIRIVTRALAPSKSADARPQSVDEPVDFVPRLEKSVSSLDESSAARLMDSIMRVIFDEVKRAAESYEKGSGVSAAILTDYKALQKLGSKKEKDDKSRDWDKLRRDFTTETQGVYSHTFCVRLLQLLYRVFVAIQEDPGMKSRISVIVEDSYIQSLLKLLFIGSAQQQFVVLQILPLMVQISAESIENACRTVLEDQKPKGVFVQRFTSSCTLDLAMLYAMKNCEGIWVSAHKNPLNYTLYKCAVGLIRGIVKRNKELNSVLINLARTLLFGSKEESGKLPNACRNRLFIELVASLLGGDFLALTKGARGLGKGRNNYSVVAFVGEKTEDKDNKIKTYEWNFDPKTHKEIMLHLIDENDGSGEASVTTLPISEFTLSEDEVALHDLALGGDALERIRGIISGSQKEGDTAIVETINVKVLRLVKKLLSQNKELCKALFSKDTIEKLLAQALKSPGYNSALSTEMAAEEMRKNAGTMEVSPLACTGNSPLVVRFSKDTLVFSFMGAKACVPILAHTEAAAKFFDRKSDQECTVGIEADVKEKFVILEAGKESEIEKLTTAAGVIVGEKLEKLLAAHKVSIPAIEISAADMQRLSGMLKDMREIARSMRTEKMGTLLADYLGKRLETDEDGVNIRSLVHGLISGKAKEPEKKSPAEEKKKAETAAAAAPARTDDPLTAFVSRPRSKPIFTKKNNAPITDEREKMVKAFSAAFPKIFSAASAFSLVAYKSTLADLRVYYSRDILISILMENVSELPKLPELAPNMYSCLQLMAIEADYMQYGFGAKQCSARLNALLNAVGQSLPGMLEKLVAWMKEKFAARGEPYKDASSNRLFLAKEADLAAPIYPRFVYRFARQQLSHNRLAIIGSPSAGEFLTELLRFVGWSQVAQDQYRCLKLIKSVLGTALTAKAELSPAAITGMLTSKCVRTMAEAYSVGKERKSIIWKNGMEIVQKANSLYCAGVEAYGERVQSHCFKDDLILHVPLAVIRAFPDWKKLITYMWIRMNKEVIKAKYDFMVETAKPAYDTQYTFLVDHPQAHCIVLNAKLPPGRKLTRIILG